MIQNIVLFLLTFIVVFIIYEIIYAKDYRRTHKLKKEIKKQNKKEGKPKKNISNKDIIPEKKPMEVRLLETYFKVDIEKLKYKSLLRTVALVSSLDISIIVSIACVTRFGLIQILIAFILVIPIIYCSYYLLAKYYNYKIKKLTNKNSKLNIDKEEKEQNVNKQKNNDK